MSLTMKAIVCKLVGDQSVNWFNFVCKDQGVFVYNVTAGDVVLEKDKTEYMFSATIKVYLSEEDWFAENPVSLTVGGTVDDLFGCLCSTIRQESRYLWLATEKGREVFGIDRFSLEEV